MPESKFSYDDITGDNKLKKCKSKGKKEEIVKRVKVTAYMRRGRGRGRRDVSGEG
jgi:hypothetical protein